EGVGRWGVNGEREVRVVEVGGEEEGEEGEGEGGGEEGEVEGGEELGLGIVGELVGEVGGVGGELEGGGELVEVVVEFGGGI
ncbi:hypothetical protein, partial [Pseudomonas aeruginosa]|uniref:hypothetical protein n=1 Tax=Pseudomonas aeruginosa TaxID=287 RepID=UPI0024BEADC9